MVSNTHPTVYMPITGKPAPPLLSVDMAADLMLIPESVDRYRSLKRYIKEYPSVMRGVQVGNDVRYRLVDVLNLMDAIMENNAR